MTKGEDHWTRDEIAALACLPHDVRLRDRLALRDAKKNQRTPEQVIEDALRLEWERHAYCRPFSKCGPEQAALVAAALRAAGLLAAASPNP